MKKWEHFSKEEIERLVKESYSYAQLAKKIGYDNIEHNGNVYRTVHKMIEELCLDTSHFTGQGWLKDKAYDNKKYIPFDEYIKGNSVQTNKIRIKLLKEGLKEYRCECCKNTTWNGQPIPLEVHHEDGNKDNNDINNLKLLCPNCHAFTDNYRGKNSKKCKSNNPK